MEIKDDLKDFKYVAEQFADLRVLRYNVKDFDSLDLKIKTLIYYLYEAALSGRDIYYDQNYKYNLAVRKTLEAMIGGYSGDKNDEEFKKLHEYAKRVWFSNGIHHHQDQYKILPTCSQQYFTTLLNGIDEKLLPLRHKETKADFVAFITQVIFDPQIAAKKINLDSKVDMVQNSAVNFYEGVRRRRSIGWR